MAIPGDKNSAWCSVVPRNFEYSTCVFCCKNLEQMHFIWVSMYLTLKQYLRTLFLRLLLKTGTPFYVVIRATRRSSRFQGKGCKFISRWLQSCRWLLLLLLLLLLCWCPVVLFCFFFVESITMILNFLPPGLHCTQRIIFWGGSTQKKIRRVCMGFSKHNWATISGTICPEMLIFGK